MFAVHSARTARLPASGTTWTFSPRRSGSRSVAAHAASPRFQNRRLYDGVHVDDKPIPVSHVADKENVDREQPA